MQFLRQELDDLPDERKPGNNRKYQVEDAVMAAFSVFFTQSPSFLDHQRLMKSNKGKDNAESLFSIKKIPVETVPIFQRRFGQRHHPRNGRHTRWRIYDGNRRRGNRKTGEKI
jgi:hypothetical protein